MKKTFTILHTNEMYSNLICMSPAADYMPITLITLGLPYVL